MHSGLNFLDIAVLVGYLVVILIIATKFVHEQHNLKDYFVASGHMPWWAVGMSILATLLSAVSITGGPAEFFEYGLQGFGIWWIATILCGPVVMVVFIRTFVGMGLTTAYEYLEQRFSFPVRLMGSVMFLLVRGLYIGVVLYASAIVLYPAFGGKVSVIWLIVLAGVFSTAFACLGGMKAVIWTDAVQLVVVYLGLGWMLISLMNRVDGSLAGMWQVAVEQGKDFSFVKDPDYWSFKLFTRTAFWPLLIGFFFNALYQLGADQLTVQRYLTTRSPRDAAKAMWTNILGAIPVTLILTLVGMGLFAFYTQNPDRVAADAKGYDWVVPHFIVSELPHGLAGLFLSAIVAAILTTVDSGINSLATVSMTDFQVRLGKRTMTNVDGVRWARIWTVIWGIITTGLGVFVYSTAVENILRVSVQTLGLFSGALLSVFLLGILTRRASSAGIYAGVAFGGGFTIWSNFFWTNSAGEHICFAWPIVFGVVITFVVGYGVSLLAPSKAKA